MIKISVGFCPRRQMASHVLNQQVRVLLHHLELQAALQHADEGWSNYMPDMLEGAHSGRSVVKESWHMASRYC
jgi:hypothetical protein